MHVFVPNSQDGVTAGPRLRGENTSCPKECVGFPEPAGCGLVVFPMRSVAIPCSCTSAKGSSIKCMQAGSSFLLNSFWIPGLFDQCLAKIFGRMMQNVFHHTCSGRSCQGQFWSLARSPLLSTNILFGTSNWMQVVKVLQRELQVKHEPLSKKGSDLLRAPLGHLDL